MVDRSGRIGEVPPDPGKRKIPISGSDWGEEREGILSYSEAVSKGVTTEHKSTRINGNQATNKPRNRMNNSKRDLVRNTGELIQACRNLKLGRSESTSEITVRLVNMKNEQYTWKPTVDCMLEILARVGVNVNKIVAIDIMKKNYNFKALLNEELEVKKMAEDLSKNKWIKKGQHEAPEDLEIQVKELYKNKMKVDVEFEVEVEMTYRRVNEWEVVKQVGRFVDVLKTETEKQSEEFTRIWKMRRPNTAVPRGFGIKLKVRGDPMDLPMYVVANSKIVKLSSELIPRQCYRCKSHYHMVKDCYEKNNISAGDYEKVLEMFLKKKEWNCHKTTKYNSDPEKLEEKYQEEIGEPEGKVNDSNEHEKTSKKTPKGEGEKTAEGDGKKKMSEDVTSKGENIAEELHKKKKKTGRKPLVDINKTSRGELRKNREEKGINTGEESADEIVKTATNRSDGSTVEKKDDYRLPNGKRQRTFSPLHPSGGGDRRTSSDSDGGEESDYGGGSAEGDSQSRD